MNRRSLILLAGLMVMVVLGGALGVASAPRGPNQSIESPTPSASFVPGIAVPPTETAQVTPQPGTLPNPEPTASTGAIPIERLPLVRFAQGNSIVLPVEVPPGTEYGIGLSGRRSLDGRGMLFYYADGKATSGFWMKNTHIDLDIAFVDSSMTVITVLQMKADTEDVHRPSRPYMAAIEAPSGYFTKTGITAGAKVEFLFDVASAVKP